MTRTLVTSALPYANGPIHFGHIAGAYLPADIYVRTLRMQGEDVRFICGTDEYGVAITLGAEREGVDYRTYVDRWHKEIRSLFERLDIDFDIFSGTSRCPQHAECAQEFFRDLHANGFLLKQETEQLYSESSERFFADRYVIGTCPRCENEEARGDECPKCGAWLDPLELGSPRSAVDGSALVRRKTTHWYLDLPKLRDEKIGAWFESKNWKPNVEAFVRSQLEGIRPRPITRDLDWGVPVPEEIAGDEKKVLYVWFDAPIGYISMTREWAAGTDDPEAWRKYWCPEDGEETRLVNFIGKDNIPFHCVVFPSMLHGVKHGYVLPETVPANEFYNLQGKKFSTSSNWSIPLDEFFERYDSDATRLYLAASMPETADSEWQWEEFRNTVNASLADTIGNLATRVLKFIGKHFEDRIPPIAEGRVAELDRVLLEECGPIDDPARHIREFRFRRATETLIANATVANVFVDRMAPWALRKTDPEAAAAVLNTCCEWIALIARWSAPFMPNKSQELWAMLGQAGAVQDAGWPALPEAGKWRSLEAGQSLGEVVGLFAKIDAETVEAELEALKSRG